MLARTTAEGRLGSVAAVGPHGSIWARTALVAPAIAIAPHRERGRPVRARTVYDEAVSTIALDGILQLVDDAEGRPCAVQLAPLGLPPVDGAALLPPRAAHDLFLLAFQRLYDAFGRPDHPSESGAPRSRDADASAAAVWDCDGYELVLAVRLADGAASVVLEIRTT